MKASSRRARRKARVYLWIVQAVVAGMFMMAGALKLFLSIEMLSLNNPWVAQVPGLFTRFIGLAEFLGGLGLFLPSILRIEPVLSVYAAFCLAFVMLLAVAFHVYRSEYAAIPINVILLVASAYVGWARLKKHPIEPKEYENPFSKQL